MNKDKKTSKTKEKKLRDLKPQKDAKGGARSHFTSPPIFTDPATTRLVGTKQSTH